MARSARGVVGLALLGAVVLVGCDLPYRWAWDACGAEGTFAQDGNVVMKCEGGTWTPGLTVADADSFLEAAYGIPPTPTPVPVRTGDYTVDVRSKSTGVVHRMVRLPEAFTPENMEDVVFEILDEFDRIGHPSNPNHALGFYEDFGLLYIVVIEVVDPADPLTWNILTERPIEPEFGRFLVIEGSGPGGFAQLDAARFEHSWDVVTTIE